jgi:hypothetical protein
LPPIHIFFDTAYKTSTTKAKHPPRTASHKLAEKATSISTKYGGRRGSASAEEEKERREYDNGRKKDDHSSSSSKHAIYEERKYC